VLLLENARVYRYDAQQRRFVRHRSILIDGERIAALDTDVAGTGVERIDLHQATIVPAFADCHVHLPETGYLAGRRSLAAVRSSAEFEEAVARVPVDGDMLYAGRYDDASWEDGRFADTTPLERHHAGLIAMLVRVDGHQSLVNRKTFAWLALDPDLPGIERNEDGEPTGRLFRDANWEAQKKFIARIPAGVRVASEERAIEIALVHGVAHIHAQMLNGTRESYRDDIERYGRAPVKIHPKICEPDPSLALAFRLPYVGGDVFLDGSLGSCTAALLEPYEGGRGLGVLRYRDDEVEAFFSAAEAAGVAAGVHAIGDAAIDQCIRVWNRVLRGAPSARGLRHFIEHFEMPAREHIDAAVRLGLTLSMQPRFQETWGQPGGMYEDRLGAARRRTMNPLRRIIESGARVCGGSDSPVCPLDPIEGMHSAMSGQAPGSSIDVHDALALFTVNAAWFGYAERETGNIEPGLCADLAVLDMDPFERGTFEKTAVLQTWVDGKLAFAS
jgi:hypothetical protein